MINQGLFILGSYTANQKAPNHHIDQSECSI